MIREATEQDAAVIASIYNWYINHTIVTFEEEPVSALTMAQRMSPTEKYCPWFVLEQAGLVVGYAYSAPWKSRAAYRLSRETTIYLQQDVTGSGLGIRLYQHLIDEIRKTPIHALIAGIALPNPASVATHEKLGFRKAGHLGEVGRKFDQFIDVGYWQLNL